MVDLEPSVSHAAGLAALATARFAQLGAAVEVYLDQVPPDDTGGPAFPYVVFWSSAGAPLVAAERLAGWGGDISTTTQATVCGLSEADVLGACDRLTLALHRRKPQLAGRVPGDIEQDGAAGRPLPDPVRTPAGRQVFTAVVFFILHSSPRSSEGA